jgi:hypothetical protein
LRFSLTYLISSQLFPGIACASRIRLDFFNRKVFRVLLSFFYYYSCRKKRQVSEMNLK